MVTGYEKLYGGYIIAFHHLYTSVLFVQTNKVGFLTLFRSGDVKAR